MGFASANMLTCTVVATLDDVSTEFSILFRAEPTVTILDLEESYSISRSDSGRFLSLLNMDYVIVETSILRISGSYGPYDDYGVRYEEISCVHSHGNFSPFSFLSSGGTTSFLVLSVSDSSPPLLGDYSCLLRVHIGTIDLSETVLITVLE